MSGVSPRGKCWGGGQMTTTHVLQSFLLDLSGPHVLTLPIFRYSEYVQYT